MSPPPEPADEEERTVVRPRVSRAQRNSGPPAAAPGVPPPGAQSSHTLHVGARLRDHEITGLIGEGGFGIVYLAWDHSLQRKVAIKEYMPASMASRVAGSSAIVVKSERHAETFRAGLKSFVNEARLLARFDHPSLVKVYRFWEENGTAYMVMPFYEGPTLKAALAGLGHRPSEAELRSWLRPLLDALKAMHQAQCFHRDIAPDNILLTARGPLLLDFGAARRVIGDMTHALTVVLKPGFAPIEQYGDVATMAQGAWTDLYALGSVVYYAITGHTPTSSVERLMDDRLEPLSVKMAGRYSGGFLTAIDAVLAVRPQDRPQSVDAFVRLLDGGHAEMAPGAADSPAGYVADSSFGLGHSTLPGTLMPELPTELHLRETPSPPPDEAADARAHGNPLEPAGFGATVRIEREAVRAAAPAEPQTALPRPDRRLFAVAAAGGLALVAAAVVIFKLSAPLRTAETPLTRPPSLAASAPVVSAPTSAPAMKAVPTAAVAEPVAPVPAPVSVAPLPLPALAPTGETTRPLLRPAPASAASAASATPTLAASLARTRRDGAASHGEARPAPEPRSRLGARCSDILQKASLEPLTGDEAAYLKRECK